MPMTKRFLVIPKEMIDNLRTTQCAGIIVDPDAYRALVKLCDDSQPVQVKTHVFDWPPTSRELSGMDRFCGGPSHEDYDAATYKGWIKPRVDLLIRLLNNALAATEHYREQVSSLESAKLMDQVKLTWNKVSEFDPANERRLFEAYARSKGLKVDLAIWNMSDPPQFKQYSDPDAQAAWVNWQEIRAQ